MKIEAELTEAELTRALPRTGQIVAKVVAKVVAKAPESLESKILNPQRLNLQGRKKIKGAALVASMLLMLVVPNAESLADTSEALIPQDLKPTYKQYIEDQMAGQIAGNNSIIYQQGSDNRALISQQYQGSGRANLAIIDQNGSNNEGTIVQRGSDNVGVLEQQGSQFKALVQQNGYNASVQISQSGSGLSALRVRQWAPSGAGTGVTVDIR